MEYISTKEYADLHGVSRKNRAPTIVCRERYRVLN